MTVTHPPAPLVQALPRNIAFLLGTQLAKTGDDDVPWVHFVPATWIIIPFPLPSTKGYYTDLITITIIKLYYLCYCVSDKYCQPL